MKWDVIVYYRKKDYRQGRFVADDVQGSKIGVVYAKDPSEAHFKAGAIFSSKGYSNKYAYLKILRSGPAPSELIGYHIKPNSEKLARLVTHATPGNLKFKILAFESPFFRIVEVNDRSFWLQITEEELYELYKFEDR